MTEARLDIILRGRVQGVGFRWWTREQAQTFGLRGTVRNRADGAVEVHAAGPADRIGQFRERLEEGPPTAGVSSVEDVQPAPEPLPESFTILR